MTNEWKRCPTCEQWIRASQPRTVTESLFDIPIILLEKAMYKLVQGAEKLIASQYNKLYRSNHRHDAE